MNRTSDAAPDCQRGSALIAALFLIVVLAALGAFAVRIGSDQLQTANLQLLQYRALAAANSGLEFWAYRASTNPGTLCIPPPAPLNFANIRGLDGFIVTVRCTRIVVNGADVVYEVTADASSGVYGSPDFVRRRLTRRMSTMPAPGVWD